MAVTFEVMGFDMFDDTLAVLEGGAVPPPLPASWPAGRTAPVAVSVREPWAAVYLVRLRRDGRWDDDLMLAWRRRDAWTGPVNLGGTGCPSPYERPAGIFVDWLRDGRIGGESEELPGDEDELDPFERGDPLSYAIGVAAASVVSVRTDEGYDQPVHAESGRFVLLVERPGPVRVSVGLQDGTTAYVGTLFKRLGT